MLDLDEVLLAIGPFGKYQKLIIWLILFPAVFPCGFHAYNQLFMAKMPEHWCRLPSLDGIHGTRMKELSIPVQFTGENETKFSQCLMYDVNYEMINVSEMDVAGFEALDRVPCQNGWDYGSEDVGNSIISEWNLVCGKDFASTLALVLFGCSGLAGNYIFGYVQDGIGRKPAYFIYLLIQCVFGIATSLAPNFYIWVLLRMGVGFTIPAILGTPYVLAIELVGPEDRTTVTILINIAYSLSLVSLAVVVWAVRSWRWMALATSVPFTALFLTWFILPESPRWLLAQGKSAQAEAVLRKIARVNGAVFPHGSISPAAGAKPEEPVQSKWGIRHLFQNPNLRWKTLIVTFLWFTNTSVYVGLSYYSPTLGGDEYLNFFLAGAVELPTYLFLWPAMERLGRRWTLCISMVVGGFSCLATALVQNNYSITLALYCVGKMGISSSFVVLPLMASELYPTVVRGLGMSLSSVVGMLGPIFIPLVNYLGSDIIILPLIIMGAMLMVGGVCSLLLPETLNAHLPQTLEDAERTKLDFFACCVPPQREPVQVSSVV